MLSRIILLLWALGAAFLVVVVSSLRPDPDTLQIALVVCSCATLGLNFIVAVGFYGVLARMDHHDN